MIKMSEFNWKLCIIGDVGAGKTSLINRFVSGKFQTSYQETIGIDMFTHDIQLNQGVEISLLIYDLGGQDYWKNLRSSFYQQSRGLILVCDVTRPESVKNLHSWYVEAIENIGYSIPTIILANKSDLEKRTTNQDFQTPFFTEHSFPIYFTSAKTGDKVIQAFTDISSSLYEKFSH